MKGFLFLSKLVFILNLLFVLCIVLRLIAVDWSGILVSILVVGGWMLAFPLNVVAAIWTIVVLARKEMEFQLKSIPFVNMLLLIFQLLFFLS
jgi:hypothetical protein